MIPGDVHHSAVEEMASLFHPDSLLPVQYFENFRRKVQTEPEKRLMLAVLEDALACFQKHFTARGGRGLRLFRETEEWIFKADSNQPFSFTNICEVVGFDPAYIREGLLKWRVRKIAELSEMAFSQLQPMAKSQVKPVGMPARHPGARSRMIGLGA
jgi:hypothetical protein